MIRKIFILAALVFSVFTLDGLAQVRHEWIAKVRETIKAKEPAWKVDESMVSGETESFRVRKGGLTGVVEITAYEVLINPEETFTGLVTVADNLSKGQKKTKLAGLGDEAYMWTGNKAGDYTAISFRKDKTFVSIYLPGRAAAQRFAKHVAANMP